MKKKLFLAPLMGLMLTSLSSCQGVNSKINETFAALEANRYAVEMSTAAIQENIQAVEEANRGIAENRQRLEEINQTLKKVHESSS